MASLVLLHSGQTYVSSAEAELETVAVEYAKPAALSSFANLKHLRIYNCLSALPPQCLTTLTALRSLHILTGLLSVDFPWTTLSSLASLKLTTAFGMETVRKSFFLNHCILCTSIILARFACKPCLGWQSWSLQTVQTHRPCQL